MLSAGEFEQALPLVRELAEQGDPVALFNMALYHEQAWPGVRPSPEAACDWHARAAARDVPLSTHRLGICHREGVGRERDPQQARHWFNRSAQLGHVLSWCTLAEMDWRGEGGAADPAAAIAHCEQALAGGYRKAHLQLARYRLQAPEPLSDPQRARAHLQAVVEDYPAAAYGLGIMARDGLAGPADPVAALGHFEAAARAGYVPAYWATAQGYQAISDDWQTQPLSAEALARAYMWLQLALRQDAPAPDEASAYRQRIAAVMPQSWRESLDKRVEDFLRQTPPLEREPGW